MRIAHVTHHFQPQLGYQESFLARFQSVSGHEVHVVTSNLFYPFKDYDSFARPILGPRQTSVGVKEHEGYLVHRLPARWEGLGNQVWLKGLEAQLRTLKPALVHVHSVASVSALRVSLLKRLQRDEFCLVIDGHASDTTAVSRPGKALFIFLYRKLCKPLVTSQADRLVAIDRAALQYMNHVCGISEDHIEVIPLGVDTDKMCFLAQERKAVRESLRLDASSVLIIYAGKVNETKRIDVLVRAVLRLRTEDARWCVLVLGGGQSNYVDYLRALAEDAGKGSAFFFHESVPNVELPRFFSAADVGVWPGHVSAAVLEAMSCGLPVVVSDNPQAAARVRYGNGFTYRTGDVADLARQIARLADPGRRRQMGRLSRQAIERHHDWRIIAREFAEIA